MSGQIGTIAAGSYAGVIAVSGDPLADALQGLNVENGYFWSSSTPGCPFLMGHRATFDASWRTFHARSRM